MVIRPSLCGILCAALSAGALSAQIPDSVFKEASASDSLYFFPSPIPLDLTALGKAARPDFQPSRPDTSLIAQFYDDLHGGSWIPFDAPLPAFVPRRHYYVLGDSGVAGVHPRNVIGSIYVNTDPAGWPANQVIYSGNLRSPRLPSHRTGKPSFGFFSPTPLRVRSAAATVGGTGQRPTIRTFLHPRRIEVALDSIQDLRDPGQPAQARAFHVLETGQIFLVARWPDGGTCEGDSVLYDITTGVARFVASSPGPCGE